MKILIMGLPGSGKTSLAKALAPMIRAVHFSADDVRSNIGRDLGFSMADRLEQARRMGWLCDRVSEADHAAIADFVCPTEATRAVFGADFTVFVDRIAESRYEDTNRLFKRPLRFDCHVTAGPKTPEEWARIIARRLRGD